MTESIDAHIGFVGAGNMAEALARGLLRAQLISPQRILAADPAEMRRNVFSSLGINVTDRNSELAECDVIILAVKPQELASVLTELGTFLGPNRLVVSIAAGWRTQRIASFLPESTRVVRVMPNTPMLVGRGVAGVTAGPGASTGDVDFVCRLFDAAGETYRVDESLMDALTAVSGTGPAYVFRIVEALTRAAVTQGIPEETARRLSRGTIIGAGHMLAEREEPASVLRERVTSPGGTTEAAMASFAEDDLDAVFNRAVDAASRRSDELSSAV